MLRQVRLDASQVVRVCAKVLALQDVLAVVGLVRAVAALDALTGAGLDVLGVASMDAENTARVGACPLVLEVVPMVALAVALVLVRELARALIHRYLKNSVQND